MSVGVCVKSVKRIEDVWCWGGKTTILQRTGAPCVAGLGVLKEGGGLVARFSPRSQS